jgi:hypothetical protein
VGKGREGVVDGPAGKRRVFLSLLPPADFAHAAGPPVQSSCPRLGDAFSLRFLAPGLDWCDFAAIQRAVVVYEMRREFLAEMGG